MITIILAAILTVFIIIILLAPLMTGDKKMQMQGWLLLAVITLGAMGLYLWRGSPDIPSKPALFETQGADFEKRRLVKKEMELMRELAAAPEDTQIMLSLGAVRLQNGHIDEAIAILTMAYDKNPEEIIPIRLKLGAAHYAAGLAKMLIEHNRTLALEHLQKALQIAPKDAPYREKLLEDLKAVQDEGD